MAREALVEVEWNVDGGQCPVCMGMRTGGGHQGHADPCSIDAALKVMGLETNEQRDEARFSCTFKGKVKKLLDAIENEQRERVLDGGLVDRHGVGTLVSELRQSLKAMGH